MCVCVCEVRSVKSRTTDEIQVHVVKKGILDVQNEGPNLRISL